MQGFVTLVTKSRLWALSPIRISSQLGCCLWLCRSGKTKVVLELMLHKVLLPINVNSINIWSLVTGLLLVLLGLSPGMMVQSNCPISVEVRWKNSEFVNSERKSLCLPSCDPNLIAGFYCVVDSKCFCCFFFLNYKVELSIYPMYSW